MAAYRKAERFGVKQSWPKGQYIEITGSKNATKVWIGADETGATVVLSGAKNLRAIAQSLIDRIDGDGKKRRRPRKATPSSGADA